MSEEKRRILDMVEQAPSQEDAAGCWRPWGEQAAQPSPGIPAAPGWHVGGRHQGDEDCQG